MNTCSICHKDLDTHEDRTMDVCVAKKLGYKPWYLKLIDSWILERLYKGNICYGDVRVPHYTDLNACFQHVVPEMLKNGYSLTLIVCKNDATAQFENDECDDYTATAREPHKTTRAICKAFLMEKSDE